MIIFSSWEPLEHFESCMDLIEEFEKENELQQTKEKKKENLIKEVVGMSTSLWIGDPLEEKYGKKYYKGIERYDMKFFVNDFIYTRSDDENKYWIAKIIDMFEDRKMKKLLTLQW